MVVTANCVMSARALATATGVSESQFAKLLSKVNVDVRVDADGRKEDGQSPAVREGVSEHKELGADPAPVATDLSIDIKAKGDEACTSHISIVARRNVGR